MPDKYPCTQCEGGYREVEEDGRIIRDACYHCGNTGFLSADEVRADRISNMISELAFDQEERNKASIDKQAAEDEFGGEGYDFGAAESQMSPHDYFMANAWANEARLVVQLGKLPSHAIDALLDMRDSLAESRERVRELTAKLAQAKQLPEFTQLIVVETGTNVSDGDIPF